MTARDILASAHRERPILMSAPMVRAILSGVKTQTRRALRVQPPADAIQVSTWHHPDSRPHFYAWVPTDAGSAEISDWGPVPCPYGAPGDALYVRETWAEVPRHEPRTDEDLPWRDDGRIVVYAADPHWEGSRQFLCADGVLRWARPDRWRPSIHMPRWASRILLEVTGVRVERLQDISEADAIAEGVERMRHGWQHYGRGTLPQTAAKDAYFCLWESINGAGSWQLNPFVWVVAFRRLANGGSNG